MNVPEAAGVTDDNASPLQYIHQSITCIVLYSLQAICASGITHDQHGIALGKDQAIISYLFLKEATEVKRGDPPAPLSYFVTYDRAWETMSQALSSSSSLGDI